MRIVLAVGVAVALLLLAGTVMAAPPGQVSDATLANLGLGQMQKMTDTQGLNVRGSGFAQVGGVSYAQARSFLGGSYTGPNMYTASSNTTAGTSALAAGATVAAAGGGFLYNPPAGAAQVSAVGGVFAFGGSVAYAR